MIGIGVLIAALGPLDDPNSWRGRAVGSCAIVGAGFRGTTSMALARTQSLSTKARQLSSLFVLIGAVLFITLTNSGGVKVPEVSLEEAKALIASGALE